MSDRVTVWINEYRPNGVPDDVEWVVEIGVDPATGAIEGEREFGTVGEAAEWAVKWLRDRGFNASLLIEFNAARVSPPPAEKEQTPTIVAPSVPEGAEQ